eukprot:945236-Alexandrium_andersonii.AAC.1
MLRGIGAQAVAELPAPGPELAPVRENHQRDDDDGVGREGEPRRSEGRGGAGERSEAPSAGRSAAMLLSLCP